MPGVEPFSPLLLERILTEQLRLPATTPLRIAYSGGLDSHVLLHALVRARAHTPRPLAAIHIDHGLQPDSATWARHCADVCRELDVALTIERVTVAGVRAHGLEDAARRARYAAFARLLAPGEVLLTAHQRDDQAETVLLQLLRGAGVPGIAAMPAIAPFAAGRLARPLLGIGRAALAAYAEENKLNFIEDRTNADTRLARSYLRARVLPLLAERWPQTAEQLARSARHSAQALQLLDEVAAADLAMCGAPAGGLAISALAALSPPRRVNLLRHWLRTRGVRAPAEYVLDQILANVERLPRSGHACVRWPDAEVRRYRDTLVVVAPAIAPADGWESAWDVAVPLAIPGTGLRLRAHETVGAGLAQARVRQRELRVRLRRGGEWCRLPGRAHRHRLKKLLQQAGVPPWERARMPLIYVDGELAAVADRWVCAPYAARAGEPGYLLVLDDAPPAT